MTGVLAIAKIDFAPRHRQPAAVRLVLATAVSLAGSLAADFLLVKVGTKAFPSTKGYTHFRFSDYSKLTVIGVVIACAAWPLVTRASSAPRWVFLRMAVLVTVVLWLPDLYILHKGQPAKAVLVLMAMHLAIGLVTYNALVRIAPTRATAPAARPGTAAWTGTATRTGTDAIAPRLARTPRRRCLELAPAVIGGMADVAARLDRWTGWRADPSKTDEANTDDSRRLHEEFLIAFRFWADAVDSWSGLPHPARLGRRRPRRQWRVLDVCLRTMLAAVSYEYTAYSLQLLGDDDTRAVGDAAVGQGVSLYREVSRALQELPDGQVRGLRRFAKWADPITQQRRSLEEFDERHCSLAAQLRTGRGL